MVEDLTDDHADRRCATDARPVVLAFISYYLPGYRAGGPVRTLANMVERLGDRVRFLIVTRDRDLGSDQSYEGVRVDEWNDVGQAQVFYASPRSLRAGFIVELLRTIDCDVLYLNSAFDPRVTILPLLLRRFARRGSPPAVLAPRGELSPGALAIKPLRKRAFIGIGKLAGLYSDVTWQASSEFERADIVRALGGAARDIRVAANLTPVVTDPAHQARTTPVPRRPGEPLRIVFLSRVSAMKNLDFALFVLSGVDRPVSFDVYGAIEDRAYFETCRRLAQAMPAQVSVRFHGAIAHEAVPACLAAHDLMFLPSRGENFGHVIFEAMSAGLPVLISDRTPWRGLVEAGVGWDIPLSDPDGFRAAIAEQADADEATLRARRAKARAHAAAVADDRQTLANNLGLFHRPAQV